MIQVSFEEMLLSKVSTAALSAKKNDYKQVCLTKESLAEKTAEEIASSCTNDALKEMLKVNHGSELKDSKLNLKMPN